MGVHFESWVQELCSDRSVDARGRISGDLVGWPKVVKNGLVIALLGLSLAKVAVERRWREFTTRADLALAVLVVVLVVAGALGTSGPALIGEAVFVYLRGALVFYAVRALFRPGPPTASAHRSPLWRQVEWVGWLLGGVIGLNIVVAVVQMVVGIPAVTGLGWVDLYQARDHRAQGLLDHPNHLGQVLSLALIGLVAWMTGQRRVSRWSWVAVAAAAAGLAATQSRQSVGAVLAAIALIWLLRRHRATSAADRDRGTSSSADQTRGGRTALIAAIMITVFAAGHMLARPGNIGELAYRLRGVLSAVTTPSGAEDCAGYATTAECTEAGRLEPREIRMLFFQQGARLITHRPVLGYGAGQFGGTVAEQHDPAWELDPRFPGGFKLYDTDGTTVDSFWLHLTVETGFVGLLAYLVWLWFVVAALLRAGRRCADEPTRAVALWGVGAMLFTVVVSVFSNSLEDALYPPLVFAILGLGWVLVRDVRHDEQPGAGVRSGDALGS